MLNLPLRCITTWCFRANPDYRLIAFQDLPHQDRAKLADLASDPDFYGFLYPQTEGTFSIKSICHRTAQLYQQLKQPGTLPLPLIDELGNQANQLIAQLVLDNVIQLGTDDGFISGPAAYSHLYTQQYLDRLEKERCDISHGDISRNDISHRAVHYVQALHLINPQDLSSRLYAYNRIPASPYWQHKLPNAAAVKQFLGILPGTLATQLLQQHWTEYEIGSADSGWLAWSSKTVTLERSTSQPHLAYKLYISPTCEVLTDRFSYILEVLTRYQVPHFKVGKNCYGLLRPDKMVAYFSQYEDLTIVANALMHELVNTPAQGVPFTAKWDDHGLLSWGIDPPQSENSSPWNDRESWRLWISNQLAIALIAAQQTPNIHIEPWQFALARLQIEGIDTTTWKPSTSIWRT